MTASPDATQLPEPPPEVFPRRFGNYTLVAPLARGGMGEVFLAKTGGVAGLEKRCVVKTLRPHLTDDREYVARFVDEARIVVQLGHRNICQVFDVGLVGERYYLAMEYIAGRDLKTLQARAESGLIEPGLAIHVVGEVLEALDYAHRHVDAATGRPLLLVHRDISPQNVMISFEGEVKLIDFGLAASAMKLEQTQPNVVMGKLAYMSPEQVRGDKVDGRTDLFAVAICLYELLVGERFYEGKSPYEIWGVAAQGSFRPRKWDTLPADLRAVLDRALAGDPAQRYRTCSELREALVGYAFQNGIRGDGPALRTLAQQRFAPEIEENRKLLQLLSTTLRLEDSDSWTGSSPTETTMSIARAISGSNEPREGTEPTELRLRRQTDGKRPFPLAVAIVIGTFFVGAGLVANARLNPPDEPIDLRSVAATLVVPAPPDPPPPAVDPVPTAPVPIAVEPIVDEPKQKRPKRTVKDKDEKQPEKGPDIVAEKPPVVEPPVEKPAEKPPSSYAAMRAVTPKRVDRVRALEQHCHASCVGELRKQIAANTWASDIAAFDASVAKCWVEACKLPK